MSGGAHHVKPGDVLAGKYRVERVLGEGGMGVVFAGHQVDLERPVALKLLGRDALGHADARARFVREARAAAALDSEHAVRVLETGTLDDGVPFIAMERLEGCDLGAAIKTLGALPPGVAALCVLQACRAIGEAHARGIIHRDIKPSNLFVARRFDGTERIVVLDFGISKAVAAEGAALDLTATRETMGSPMYMSPEQVRSSKHVDARSDVWALGVVLYELLTGVPPFLAPSLTALSAMIVEEDPRPPHECRADVPHELERIVLRCLQKRPEQRFASVAELMSALVPFAAGAELHLAARVAALAAEAPPNSRADTLPASALDLGKASTRAPVERPLVTTDASRVTRSRIALAALGFALAAGTVATVAMRLAPRTDSRALRSAADASVAPSAAACVEAGRHAFRRSTVARHLTMASGLEHGLLVEWGFPLGASPRDLVSDMLPLAVPMPASAELAPVSVPFFDDTKQLRVATATLHDDVVLVAALRAPHFRNPRAECTRWAGYTPDAKGAFTGPLGARVVTHATTDLAVATSITTVTVVSLGERVDVETAKEDAYEVRIGSLFGPSHERVVLEGPHDRDQPLRVMATAARTRPIAVVVGPAGVTSFALVDGDAVLPAVPLTRGASSFVAAASRGDESFVAWIDGSSGEARYRRMPEGDAVRFEDERTLPMGRITSLALASRGSTIAIAWSDADEKGRRVHAGLSHGSLEDAVAGAQPVDVDGDVRALALSEHGMWMAYGGATSLGLVAFSCPK